MTLKFVFLIFLVSTVTVVQIAGQYGCRPEIVTNMVLHDDVLTWELVDYEKCNISYYLVEVESLEIPEDPINEMFIVIEQTYDFTNLPKCERFVFTVTIVSTDNLEGSGRTLYTKTSPPSGADLSLQYLNVTQMPTWIRLDWDLQEEWRGCANEYRILTYDEDHDIPEDIYISSNYVSLTRLTPCTSYTIAVTALFNLLDEGPPSVMSHTAIQAVPTAPVLSRVFLHSTSIELSWTAQPSTQNRCPITSVNVNAAPYFSVSYPVRDDPDHRGLIFTTLPGLQPDTMYYVNVSITNSAGVSPNTLLLVQTLDRD